MVKVAFMMALALLAGCGRVSVPQHIMNSVVLVDSSSGVVVYSDQERSLVLTAFHVVKGDLEEGRIIKVGYLDIDLTYTKATIRYYDVGSFKLDPTKDLALLEIHPGFKLDTSRIARSEPALGDDVWIGANPNLNYRSLKRGVVSSKDRLDHGNVLWELSGGVIFGSSGGGAFNQWGEEIAVVHSVDAYDSELCDDNDVCMPLMLPEMGYFIPLADVTRFLLRDSSSHYFDYLK